MIQQLCTLGEWLLVEDSFLVYKRILLNASSLVTLYVLVCIGLSVPDPPRDVSVTTAFTNYTTLEALTFNFIPSKGNVH